MMRLIRLDGQIRDEAEFAFYDTVVERFVKIGDDQTWTCLDSLAQSFSFESADERARLESRLTGLARSAGYPQSDPDDE